MRRLGVEVDEALIANGIYARGLPLYSWKTGATTIPVMILSYLGALKTWIYLAIFSIWEPDAISLRLPMMLTGVATLCLFFALLHRIAGRTAAYVGTALLATDPSFVLNEAIDFGPVALHHFLKMAALTAIVLWHQSRRGTWLAIGFFCLGLALWDKALFAWTLAGLGVAALAVYPHEIVASLKPRFIAIALVAFSLGAAPLIAYNIEHPLNTLRANTRISSENSIVKLWILHRTLTGTTMFGFFTADTPGPKKIDPQRGEQRLALAVASIAPFKANLDEYAAGLAILAIPLLWRTPVRRPMVFALIALVVTWLLMFATTGAGTSAHHVLLLWPFHLVIIALAASQLRPRLAIAAVAVVLCASNLAVMNQYYTALILNGTSVRWTDAFPELIRTLEKADAAHVYTADWGITETVNLLTEGRVPVAGLDESSISPTLFLQSNSLFVAHGTPYLQTPKTMAALTDAARSYAFQKEPVTTIYDRNGRGIFEVFRFRRSGD